jgi:predicted TIM-barrel fold metal-dependent hydrolase
MYLDVDQHIHEPRSMWRDHIDPQMRDRALAIEDDASGYSWLTWQSQKLYLAEVQQPGRAKPIGEHRKRLEAGLPNDRPYDDECAPEYTDAKARVAKVREFGLDAAVQFPNFGLLWEDMLARDPEAQRANMRAWNRWIAGVVADGEGVLHGVAHMELRDPLWVEEECARLERDGIRLAMVAPAPVDGKPLAHRDLDPVWRSFSTHNVAPVFHVGGFQQPLHPVWYEDDPEPVDKLMGSVFIWVAPAVALANMSVYGVFERFPELRVGVVELTAHWVPELLMMLDGAWGFYAARHGAPLTNIPLRPSEYIRRQVRVAALAYESPGGLIEKVGEDMFMFGSDWPHSEGIKDPIGDYERCVPETLTPGARQKLFSGNAEWLLGVA